MMPLISRLDDVYFLVPLFEAARNFFEARRFADTVSEIYKTYGYYDRAQLMIHLINTDLIDLQRSNSYLWGV